MVKEGFIRETRYGFIVEKWSVICDGKNFVICNNGMKLAARNDEDLEKLIFDVEKKTVSAVVKNPTLHENAPRTADLSEAVEFFEKLRDDIEIVMTTKMGGFSSVIPNEDRTVFTVS